MNSEIQSIFNAFEQRQHQGKFAFLATVVGTQGSTYRRPGARLLITEDGQTVGLVSGGCLVGTAAVPGVLSRHNLPHKMPFLFLVLTDGGHLLRPGLAPLVPRLQLLQY